MWHHCGHWWITSQCDEIGGYINSAELSGGTIVWTCILRCLNFLLKLTRDIFGHTIYRLSS